MGARQSKNCDTNKQMSVTETEVVTEREKRMTETRDDRLWKKVFF